MKTKEEILIGYSPETYKEDLGWLNKEVLEIMQEYASQSKWIDVETPPTDSEYVLGATKSGILCYLVCYHPSFNMWMGYGESQVEERITHWQPLPQTPIQNQ